VKAETTHDEPLSTAREVQLLGDLQGLADESRQTKARLRTFLADGLAQAKKALEQAEPNSILGTPVSRRRPITNKRPPPFINNTSSTVTPPSISTRACDKG
jgi:hypothetical protein